MSSSTDRRPDDAGIPDGVRRLRLLQLASLISTCDRFAIAPLLVPIAAGLGVPLTTAAAVAGGYFLAYGLMQVVWGVVSDRLGRVRVMRLALVGAVVAGAVSAVAPNATLLILARVVTGGCFAALIPASLVYVGDTWPESMRQRPLSDVLAASALGTAAATAGAGLLADLLGWRSVFALTAAAGVGLLVALRRLPEPAESPATGSGLAPDGDPRSGRDVDPAGSRAAGGRAPLDAPRSGSGGDLPGRRPSTDRAGEGPGRGDGSERSTGTWRGLLRPVGVVLRDGWARVVLLLAFVEGIVVLAVLTYLAPALQSLGSTAAVAGLVSGAFGVAALLLSRLVRRLVGRVPPAGLAAIGGAFLLAAWTAPSITVNTATVLAAGAGLGGAWAFLHSTLQAWATQVTPHARAAAVALFATVLFLGSSAGTAAAAPLAEAGAFRTLFVAALLVAAPLVVAAVVARLRYARSAP